MRKFFKYVLVFLLIACVFSLAACAQREIASMYMNDEGHIIIEYTDGTSADMGQVVAPAQREISSVYINDEEHLVIEYTDGTSADMGEFEVPVQSEIASMHINSEGRLIIHYVNGTSSDAGVVKSNSTQTAVNRALLSSVSIICDHSAGSGVIYQFDKEKGSAYIITNYHVVFDADNGLSDTYSVFIYGQEYSDYAIPATYVGGSLTYDIAILQVLNSDVLKQSDCEVASIGDSNAVTPGLTAIAVGNPEGKGISATLGIVNVDSEEITMKGADDITTVNFRVMRIDTPVNSGNSGGGLFDGEGNLIGIVNAKIKDNTIENIGYAIPSCVAINVVKNILYNRSTRQVQKCLLGVTVTGSPSKAVYDELSGKTIILESVTVVETAAGSLSQGKFLIDDIVLSATVGKYSMNFTRSFHIVDFMLLVNNGDTVTFTVLRGGVETEVIITIPANHAIEIY